MAHDHVSLAEYLAAERVAPGERRDYLDGTVHVQGPQPRDHATIITNLVRLLGAALGDAAPRVFAADARAHLTPTCIVHPDVWVSAAGGTQAPEMSPLLAIEVFTPETVAFDLGPKAHHYRLCPTLAEYVLIDDERPFVHVQRRPTVGNHWDLRDYRDATEVELRCLGITLPLAAIYHATAVAL